MASILGNLGVDSWVKRKSKRLSWLSEDAWLPVLSQFFAQMAKQPRFQDPGNEAFYVLCCLP